MFPLQINRRRDTSVDPKKALRAHIDQLPLEQQHKFVSLALQLMSARTGRQLVPLVARRRTG